MVLMSLKIDDEIDTTKDLLTFTKLDDSLRKNSQIEMNN
jgi:hypothetical protein